MTCDLCFVPAVDHVDEDIVLYDEKFEYVI